MGIQSASATFSRFFIPEPVTEDFWSFVDERLQAGSFKESDDAPEQSVGFATWEDFFEATFPFGSYHKGEYVAFQFRVDQRKVPGILKKKYVHQAVQKYRAEHEGKWPSRQEKQEIRENVDAWLMSRTLPQPSACEVVWNPAARWLYLGTTSTKMMELFLEHFENQFRLYPVPLYHAQWGLNLIPLDGRQKDVLAGLVPVQSPQAMEEGRFLGHEFLTWLWFFMERFDGRLPAGEGKEAHIHLGERLVLTLPGDSKERVVCTTQANALHEARTALKQGKLVQEIQLYLAVGENEYFLTLDSALWAVKGLKTPKQMPNYDEEDPDGRFLERMYFLEEAGAALDALYGRFLAERLSPTWESDSLPLLTQWVAESTDAPQPVPQPGSAPF